MISFDEIIEHVETQRSSDLNQSTYSSHKGLSEENQRVLMDEVWFRNGEKFYDSFKLAFNNVINRYSKEHKFFSCQRHTDFRLNKYDEGGFMSTHCDNIHHSHGQEYGFPQVTALLFLNDNACIKNLEYNKCSIACSTPPIYWSTGIQ